MSRVSWALLPLVLVGCVAHQWRNLPPGREGVLAWRSPDDVNMHEAVLIARRLLRARPLPVDAVYLVSTGFLNANLRLQQFPDDNAGATRCGKGDPPPYGCIVLGDQLRRSLSEEGLAAVLAHELGHLELGHRGTGIVPIALGTQAVLLEACSAFGPRTEKEAIVALVVCATGFVVTTGVAAHGAAVSRDKEREADASARERLATAGYCAGPVMRATFAQLSRAFPHGGGFGLFSTHPGYRERWETAGLDCGPGYVAASRTPGLEDADTAAESTAALFDGERPRQPSWRLVGSDGLRFWRRETCVEAKRKLEKYNPALRCEREE